MLRNLLTIHLFGVLSVLELSVPALHADAILPQAAPNVVFILADDLGYGDLGCYGATKVKTPYIDRIAAEGRLFTDAHTASAVCTPSRYALLTGEYPFRATDRGRDNLQGIWAPLNWYSPMLIPKGQTTIGSLFQDAGYATSYFGKWHLGFGDEKNDWSMPLKSGPNDVGFDYYYGVPRVNSNPPYVYVEDNMVVGHEDNDPLVIIENKEHYFQATKTRQFPEEASVKSPNSFKGAKKAHALFDDEKIGMHLTEKALSWIDAHKDRPFCLIFATTQIHHPFTPAPRFQGTSEAGLYGDFIHEFDWMVGQIEASLEKNGLSKNTLLIITSDNGGMWNLGGRMAEEKGHRINGELLGSKFSVWEGGHRVPFIAKWPGKIPPGTTSDQLICNVDMLETLGAAIGQKANSPDGKNMLEAFTGNPQAPLRDEVILAGFRKTHLSLRQGKWMFIPRQGGGGFPNQVIKGSNGVGGMVANMLAGKTNSDFGFGEFKRTAAPAQLYDLSVDIAQTQNVYQENPKVVEAMAARLKELTVKQK